MEKSLQQFLAICETGSFLAAAERLLVSQPALTYSMKNLENRLGVQLFVRSARGVSLTRYGETLHAKSLMMRRLYQNALDTIERQRVETEDGISIGTGYSTWILFLKDYAVEHAKLNPNAPINLSIANAQRCMEQLIVGDISLFVGHKIPNLAAEIEVDFIPLGMATDGYFVREGHPLLSAQRSLNEVFDWPTAMALPSETRQRQLQTISSDQEPDRSGHVFTSNSLEACISFINETDAVLIHTNLLSCFFEVRGARQVDLLPNVAPPSWLLGIYVLTERRNDPNLVQVVRLIREKAQMLDLASPTQAA